MLSTSISFALYSSVSILGVLAFGVGDNQLGSTVLDLMPVRKDEAVFFFGGGAGWLFGWVGG